MEWLCPVQGRWWWNLRTAGIIWGQTHLSSSMATCIKMFLIFIPHPASPCLEMYPMELIQGEKITTQIYAQTCSLQHYSVRKIIGAWVLIKHWSGSKGICFCYRNILYRKLCDDGVFLEVICAKCVLPLYNHIVYAN